MPAAHASQLLVATGKPPLCAGAHREALDLFPTLFREHRAPMHAQLVALSHAVGLAEGLCAQLETVRGEVDAMHAELYGTAEEECNFAVQAAAQYRQV